MMADNWFLVGVYVEMRGRETCKGAIMLQILGVGAWYGIVLSLRCWDFSSNIDRRGGVDFTRGLCTWGQNFWPPPP